VYLTSKPLDAKSITADIAITMERTVLFMFNFF
jgi:hypothetical protein